jgi:hypothetical protein
MISQKVSERLIRLIMLAAQGLLEISLVDPHTYEKALKRLLIMGSRVRVPPRSPNKLNTMYG